MEDVIGNRKKNSFTAANSGVDGNWPSFIYIPVSGLDLIPGICINHFQKEQKLEVGDITREEKTLHLSLSKPFTLRHHQIDTFIQQLGKELSGLFCNRLCLEVYREYYILNNECRSRSFVCLPTEDRTGILLKLVRAVDTVMKSFRREEYYKVPKFHISVASLLYQDTFICEKIVEVPVSVVGASNVGIEGGDATDIFKFSTLYSETNSDDDDDNREERTDKIVNHSDCDTDSRECASSIEREQVNCSLIECAIGNRLFQFTAASLRTSSKAEFIEVVHKEKILQSILGSKRKQ